MTTRAICVLSGLLALCSGARADVVEPPGKAEADLTARQTGERLDLRLEQARRAAQARRDEPGMAADQARRLEQRQTVERLRQQSQHEEQRYELERTWPRDERRPGFRGRADR